MVTPEQIWAFFEYPLVLLGIGAVLSFGLGTWLTKRWEDRRKEVDIKVEIVSKMDEAVTRRISKAFSLTSTLQKTLNAEEEADEVEKLKN